MKGYRLPGITLISLVDSLQTEGQGFEPPQLHQNLHRYIQHLLII